MRFFIFLMICFILAGMAWTKEMTIEEQRTMVRAVLSEIAPDDEKTLNAEVKLVENNDITTDVCRLILNDKKADLSALERDFDAVGQDKTSLRRMRMEIDILSDAIINREWKINPRKLVFDWLAEKKNADGNPFEPDVQPRIIDIANTAKFFPDYVFYKVIFSPYPVPRVLPAALSEQNIFAVDKTGKITYLPDPTELEKFWKNTAAPVKTEIEAKEAVNFWLLLSTQYSANIALNFINPKLDEIAVNTSPTSMTAAGKANIMNAATSVGTLTATMTFDTAAGKLQTAKEARYLRRGVTYQISGIDGWY